MEQNQAEILTFNKNQVIFRQGESSPCMYDVHWGKVGIYADYGTPNEKLLTELLADEFFGEMGMIENCPRSATAVALERNTKVQVITPETFQRYFTERPSKVLQIMQHMSQRLRRLTKDYMEACQTVTNAADQSEQTLDEELQAKLKHYSEQYQKTV